MPADHASLSAGEVACTPGVGSDTAPAQALHFPRRATVNIDDLGRQKARLLRGQIPRIGVLALGSPPAAPDWKARLPFVQALRTLGWLDGQNLVLEYRWAAGQPHRLSPLAAELVRLPVDAMVAGDTTATRAVTQATTIVPIVMVSVI